MQTAVSRPVAWSIWLIGSIFYAYQYVLRVMPNIMMSDIMEKFSIDAATFGQFSGIYYIGYSMMHLPIGIMLDRIGPKKVMAGSILLSILGLLPLIFASSWQYPVLGRLLVGMGSSGAILSVFKVIRIGFSEGRFPRMLSFAVMIGLIGAIYGGGPLNYMCRSFGAETVMVFFALLGVFLALFSYLLVPEIPKTADASIWDNVKELFSNKAVMFICFMSGLMVGPLEGFADVWGSTYLREVYQYDPSIAASLPSVIFVGMCFGAPVLNFFAERTKNYFGTISMAGFLMALIFMGLLLFIPSVEKITVGFALVGIFSSYQILAIFKASSLVRQELVGLTSAVANMIIMLFGYGFHTLISLGVAFYGGPKEAFALRLSLSIIPITLIVGALGFFFLQKRAVVKKQAL